MEVLAEICGVVLLLVCVFVPVTVTVLELLKRDRRGRHERARREADAARLAGHVSDEALRKYVEGR
jgi:hypothetical protein